MKRFFAWLMHWLCRFADLIMRRRRPPRWFDKARIWSERSPSGQVAMLRHTAYPFPGVWDERSGSGGLARIANAYLAEVWDELEAPTIWLEDIASSVGESIVHSLRAEDAQTGLPYLRWLPFASPDPSAGNFEPRGSAWLTRRDKGGGVLDRTAILIGVLSVARQGSWIPLYGHQGVRVLMHVAPNGGPQGTEVRITGLTTTLPQWTLRAYRASATGHRHAAPSRGDWEARRLSLLARQYQTKPVLPLKVGEPGWRIQLPDGRAPSPSTEYFTVSLGKRLKDQLLLVARVPDMQLTANQNADVFTQDLMARYGAARFHDTRPNRTWEDADWLGHGLAPVRDTVVLNLPPDAARPPYYLLEDQNVNVRVTFSRHSAADRMLLQRFGLIEDDTKRVSDPADLTAGNRTDATTSVTAFYHANDLFVRLRRWRLQLDEMFRFVNLPLIVRYRHGMHAGPGKDGRTVNAQVAIDKSSIPWQIEARFGLADLRASPERSPLGLACDPRWVWHEFGHVLLAGAVGELEFRFAHSAGDALAAILFDPGSQLAGHLDWRGVTFPWVTQPRRRHDRKVKDGWGWGGALYQRERFFTDEGHCAKAGYWAEQILSSTLFRLYRGLGGDTEQAAGVPDVNARLAAAEYSAYLIARAIGILGDAPSIPACTPDQFVSALIDADCGTSEFDDGSARPRIGGAARKVIRWAFQQQGLYARSTDGLPTGIPGEPEDVDLHIEDQRDQATICAPGTYAPIKNSLEWPADPTRFWIRRSADGVQSHQPPQAGAHNWIYCKVRNLGPLQADQVTLHVWRAKVDAGDLLDPSMKWRRVGSFGPVTIGGGAETTLGPIDWDLTAVASGKRFALLAAVNCPADQANVDPDTELPCAFPHPLNHNGPFKSACPIDQLVAYDNNLGLRDLTTAP